MAYYYKGALCTPSKYKENPTVFEDVSDYITSFLKFTKYTFKFKKNL